MDGKDLRHEYMFAFLVKDASDQAPLSPGALRYAHEKIPLTIAGEDAVRIRLDRGISQQRRGHTDVPTCFHTRISSCTTFIRAMCASVRRRVHVSGVASPRCLGRALPPCVKAAAAVTTTGATAYAPMYRRHPAHASQARPFISVSAFVMHGTPKRVAARCSTGSHRRVSSRPAWRPRQMVLQEKNASLLSSAIPIPANHQQPYRATPLGHSNTSIDQARANEVCPFPIPSRHPSCPELLERKRLPIPMPCSARRRSLRTVCPGTI